MTTKQKAIRARWIVSSVDKDNIPRIHNDGMLVHDDSKVIAVGTHAELSQKYPDIEIDHYPQHMVMPGFINSHHHVGLTPLQLGSPDYALELWFASRIACRSVDTYLDTMFSAFEMIASGVTCVQHLQGFETGGLEAVYNSGSSVLRAYRDIGMRASYGYLVREQNQLVYEADADFIARLPSPLSKQLARFLDTARLSLDEHIQLYSMMQEENRGQSLTRVQLAPANLHWVSDAGLLKLFERARQDGVPLHMHLLETAYQKEYARRRTGTTAVRHLHKLGLLGPDLTLGHAVWLDQEDVEIVAHTETCVCHNCSSNYRLRSGLAPVNELARRNVAIGLGMDEAGINDDRDMLFEMRMALRSHRVPGMEDADVPSCGQVLKMATEHGGKSTSFRGEIGQLEVGMQCDAVVVDYQAATYPYQDDLIPALDAIIQRATPRHVCTVYVAGDPIYSGGRFKYVDRDAILARIAEDLAKPRTEEEEIRRNLARDVFPYVKQFYAGYLDGETARQPYYGTSSRV